jgi:CRP-like cAMP-binding protein
MTGPLPDLLTGLDQQDANAILALGSPVRLVSGSTLFRLGSEADSLFVVERGRIALTMPMQVAGREEQILIEERAPGQTVGWSAITPPHRFTLNATAPLETHLVALARQALMEHFETHAAAGYVVMRNVAAIVGQRLQVVQAMWLREMQRVISSRCV